MRILQFDGSDPQHHSIFNLLMTAWHYVDRERGLPLIQVGTTPERIECAIDVNKALRGASHGIGDGMMDLVDEGATIALRDSAFELLREAWTAYRRLIPTRLAELAQATDSALADAVKMTDEEWETTRAEQDKEAVEKLLDEAKSR